MRIKVGGTVLFVDVEGARLRVEGDRLVERPVVVVLHGGPGFDQGYLRPDLAALADHAQLVFPDLRGQGRSGAAPLETCTLERMADDVAELCDVLGLDAPIVLGHSAGGFVALHLALRHPASVGALVLCNTTPTLAPLLDPDPPAGLAERAGPEAAQVAHRLFAGDFSTESTAAFDREVLPYYAGPTHTDIPARLMALSPLSTDVAAYFFGNLAPTYDLRPRLRDISAPTLVVTGRHDWVCPPVAGHQLATDIPHARLAEIPNAGHFPHAEEPTAFLAAVTPFLTGYAPGRTRPDS
jgi:proline iminopeptidase